MVKILLISTGLLFASASASAANAADVQYNIRVDGMTCPFCVATSEKALKKIKGVTRVSTNLKKGLIRVCTADSVTFTDKQLKTLFLKKGFTYKSMTKDNGCTIKAAK